MTILGLPTQILSYIFSFNFTTYDNIKDGNKFHWDKIRKEYKDLAHIAQVCKAFKTVIKEGETVEPQILSYRKLNNGLKFCLSQKSFYLLADTIKHGLLAVDYFCAIMQSNCLNKTGFFDSEYLDRTNSEGYTPLIQAIKLSTLEIVAYLLDRGASVSVLDTRSDKNYDVAEELKNNCMPPLSWAIVEGNFPIIQIIFEKCIEMKNGYETEALGRAGVSTKKWFPFHPLHIAMLENNIQAVELLCSSPEIRADISTGTYAGLIGQDTTPLNIGIVKRKNIKIIELLIQAGARTTFALSYATQHLQEDAEYYQAVIKLIKLKEADEHVHKKIRS
ncbi:MAG: ankyrin repeat domain-containing protein [Rhabdochlamydiaceae bacterium]